MSSSYGENIRLTVFGQSHSPAIGMTLEGVPAGCKIDMGELKAFLKRRAPGQNAWSTPRKEDDEPEFLCGLKDNITCGTPITAIIRNANTRSKDYSKFADTPRPGHADYTAEIKYFGFQDYAGGGHFSGRLTSPLCVAGGMLKQLLKNEGIEIFARVSEIGGIKDEGKLNKSVARKSFPTLSDSKGEEMKALILKAVSEGDSVGGVVECACFGVPAGLGDPIFDGMENRIAKIIFGIPAVKGIEFGAGFALSSMRGSQSNDEFAVDDGRIVTKTNNCGGILGGITNGMPLTFRAAFKPTPSISRSQTSVSLSRMEASPLEATGRHDPCIVPRAVPCVEAAAAIAIYDALLLRRRELYGHLGVQKQD